MPNLTDPGHGPPSELKAIAITIHVLLTIVTILGNSLVITAFHKFSSLQSASNAILVSLSVADILMTVSFVLNIANIIVGKTTSRVLCSFASTVSLTFNAIIILHLALISAERFIAIKFALRYHTIVTNRRATMMSLVVWLWGIAVVLIFPKVLKTDGLQAFEEFLQALSPCFDRHHQPFILQSSSARLYLVFLWYHYWSYPLWLLCHRTVIFSKLLGNSGDRFGRKTTCKENSPWRVKWREPELRLLW